MSRSFFTGTDHAVYTGSKSFAAQISQGPSVYGLTQAQADAYAVLNDAYAQAYLAAIAPETRTHSAVVGKNDAKAAVCAMASDLCRIIAGNVAVSDEMRVDLGLSVRATPTPMGLPGTPDQISVSLSAIGSLTLRWKCSNPKGSTGTLYHVFRQVDGVGPFVYLDSVGKKRFEDLAVPAGAKQIVYRIKAVRSTKAGQPATFAVNIGTSGCMTPTMSLAA